MGRGGTGEPTTSSFLWLCSVFAPVVAPLGILPSAISGCLELFTVSLPALLGGQWGRETLQAHKLELVTALTWSGGFHPSGISLGWSGSLAGFTELEVHIMETLLVLELMAQL